MIGSQNVTFKTVDAQIENVHTGDDRKTMDVCEITYPDGKVVAFPVHDVSPEDGRKYSEIYSGKYQAFKNGEPDQDKVDSLNREIEAKQAELKALDTRPNDDRRVKENLGYGKLGEHEPFDHMTKAELNDWIDNNSDQSAPSDANKAELVEYAKKAERKQKKAAS